MVDTNPRAWAWDSTSLETYAHGIEELTEGRSPLPPLRGEDSFVLGATGRLFRPKVADSRVVPLTMWVNGADDAGNILDEDEWRYSIQQLRALLWDPSAEHALSKGVYSNATTIVRASAGAQVTGGLLPNVEDAERGLQIARMSVDFTLSYPYFIDASMNEYL